MNRLTTFLFALFFLALAQKSTAQSSPFKSLLNNLEKFSDTYPQEKIHIHTDKPYYVIGEDIWLKAYLVQAEKNEPSLLSKVLYINLLDDKNRIKKTAKLEVINGFAHGSINLLDSLKAGRYNLIAYTNYMRNYSPSFFFDKSIVIGDVAKSEITEKLPTTKLKISLKFFPEGGNFVEGIRSKIGIKALTSDGFGANLSGYIINSKNEKIIDFSTDHAGMGITALTPMPSENYIAIVVTEDGMKQEFKLPKAEKTGYVLSLNNLEKELMFSVTASAQLVNGQELYATAQNNGRVYKAFNIKVENQSLSTKFEKKDFPTGITQFTLFDDKLNTIAERLVFVNHNDSLKFNLHKKSDSFINKKDEFELSTTDQNNNPIEGNFSISVINKNNVIYDEDDEITILSNLLLTSDLKGFVEKPNYYFNKENVNSEKHLDNLLLTQGWTRFAWSDVINKTEQDITFRAEQSLEITGKISNEYNKPLNNAKVSLISNTPGLFLKLDTISDINGNFVFDRLDVPSNASFILQSTGFKNSKEIKLTIDSSPNLISKNLASQQINIETYKVSAKKMFEEMVKHNMMDNRILLNTVEIKAPITLKSLLNVPNSANASGAADQVITQKMLKGAINMLSPFYKTPGVMVKNGILYNVKGRNSILKTPPPYTIILDGSIVSQDILTGIHPSDVAGIEVLSSTYNTAVYGQSGAGGVIHITSLRGGARVKASTNTAKISDFGFSPIKEFYIPDYDDPKTNNQFRDMRNTIYWNPNLITNGEGKVNFSFFNASNPGTYQVTIEGMDLFGNLGRKVLTYEVK